MTHGSYTALPIHKKTGKGFSRLKSPITPDDASLIEEDCLSRFKRHEFSQNSITEGVIWKNLLAFFFPILLGTFFQQLYDAADAVIVGKFVGKEALAAVGGPTGALVTTWWWASSVGLSSGATVILSRFYGGRRDREVWQAQAVRPAAAVSLAGGALFSRCWASCLPL